MSAFKQMRDISNYFEQQVRTASAELFAVTIGESFEDDITKKMRSLNFFTSKLRLLKAKQLASTPQVIQQPKTESIIQEYGELASWKVLEQCIVKSLTQAHAVKALVTSPDVNLDPEMVQRKQNIIDSMQQYHAQESKLRELEHVYREKEEELAAARELWDQELTLLRQMKEQSHSYEHTEDPGPLYNKVQKTVRQLELVRWLLSRLVCARSSRDYLAEPARTAQALRLTRARYSVDGLLAE